MRETLWFFSGNVASGVADVESLFLHFRGSAPQCGKTVDKKGTGLCRKLDLHSYFKMLKNWQPQCRIALLEDEVGKMRTRVQRELGFIK